MPTLDDTTTLPTNAAVAGNDALLISNKDSSGSSLIQQVPAALIREGFSHAFLFNFDNPTLAADSTEDAISFNVHTFVAGDKVNFVRLVTTKPFTGSDGSGGSLTSASVTVGINDQDVDGYIQPSSVLSVGFVDNTGSRIDSEADVIGGFNDPTDGDTFRITFNPAGVNNNELTAGQFVVLANIINAADYADCVPAL
tara:strand:- start:59 stop:649 length:591 start_codon:yes stop_codon:yes gene_type:complete